MSTVLTVARCAVLAGARTLLAISEWAADSDRTALSHHGIDSDAVLPCESTIRRTLALLDADAFDRALAAWMAVKVGHLHGRRVIAINGKTMRGARREGDEPHLVAALEHATGAVMGQGVGKVLMWTRGGRSGGDCRGCGVVEMRRCGCGRPDGSG